MGIVDNIQIKIIADEHAHAFHKQAIRCVDADVIRGGGSRKGCDEEYTG